MNKQQRWVVFAALAASLVACSSGETPPGSGSAGSSGSAAGNTSGAGAGGAASTPGSSSSVPCAPGIAPTSQVPRMKDAAYDRVVRDLLGLETLASAGNAAPSSLLAADYDGSLTDIAWNGYLSAAAKIAAEVMAGPNRSKFMACDPAASACLVDTIRGFGRKAFRRPLTDAEVQSFQRLDKLTPKGTPAEVAEAVLFAFLASPSFILLPELAQQKQGEAFQLSSYEVAARLSFLLWGSVPDDELAAAADSGQLSTQAQIAGQAQRLLKSEKARPVSAAFHRFYAGVEPASHWVNNTEHFTGTYPKYSTAAYAPMMAELDSFFQEVALQGGTFRDLFLSNVGFVSAETAPLYGLDSVNFSEPQRVELDATRRPGFLTRLAFLSTFSKFDATSPILRGAFVSGRVLGINPGTPDPNALKTPIPPGSYATRRQQIEALTANEPCKSCHGKFINPAGFVLERYDAVGSWQDTDPLGGVIDSSADVYFSATNTKTIASPLELMSELAASPEARRHYAEQWVSYATGRVANANDACIAETLAGKLADPAYPLVNMIADYTQADAFRLRSVGN